MQVEKQETQKLNWNGVDLMSASAILNNKQIVLFNSSKKINSEDNFFTVTDEDFLEFVHKVTGEMITHLRKERGFRSEEEVEESKAR